MDRSKGSLSFVSANFRYPFIGVIMRLAGSERVFVKLDGFVIRPTETHGSHGAVAKGPWEPFFRGDLHGDKLPFVRLYRIQVPVGFPAYYNESIASRVPTRRETHYSTGLSWTASMMT